MALIFISYSSKDAEVAVKIQEFFSYIFGLKTEEVFLAAHSIRAGAQGEERILDAIRTSEFHIFLISEHFFESPYCMCELGAAWGSRKTPYKFLFEPITSRDDRYESLPPFIREAQFTIIREGDRASIRRFIDNIIEDVIRKTNRTILGSKNDLLLDLANYLSVSPLSKKVLDLRCSSHFHHPSEAKSTLVLRSTRDTIIMHVDFKTLKPQFAGGVIKLFGEDWSAYHREGFSLYFDISATPPLSKIKLEIKDADGLVEEDIDVTPERRTVKLSLQDLNVQQRFRKMSELVFLVEPENLKSISNIEISNVFLDR